MIERLPEMQGNVIAIRMSGTITEEQQDEHFDWAEEMFSREKVENVVLDWSALDGWAKGARSAGTWYGMHHRVLVRRVAIIAEDKWDDEVLRITDIFHMSTVRRFAPAERDAAFAWVRST